MNRAARRLGILPLLALLMSCGSDVQVPADRAAPIPAAEAAVEGKARSGFTADSASAAPQSPSGRPADSLVPSMIIRTGQVEIKVDSLDPAIRLVEALARRVGGFIANSSIQSGEGQRRQATLQIKVPAARYEQAMSGLTGIGKLISATTDAQDVGEEYVDMTARMSNARRLESAW